MLQLLKDKGKKEMGNGMMERLKLGRSREDDGTGRVFDCGRRSSRGGGNDETLEMMDGWMVECRGYRMISRVSFSRV